MSNKNDNDYNEPPSHLLNLQKPTLEEIAAREKKQKRLSRAFNAAAFVGGIAASVAIKAATAAVIVTNPWLALVVSSIAIGTAITAINHTKESLERKRAGLPTHKFISEKNIMSSIKNGIFAFAGGALFFGLADGTLQDFWNKIFGSTPAPAAEPVVGTITKLAEAAPAVVIPCPTPLEHFNQLIDGQTVSERVKDALHRAASENAKTAAQGIKDLGYFAFNGFDGVPKNTGIGLELFQKAADAGNLQSQVDMVYTQFHGLATVTPAPQAAINTMSTIATAKADLFVAGWNDLGVATEALTAFDSKSILQGMKFCK